MEDGREGVAAAVRRRLHAAIVRAHLPVAVERLWADGDAEDGLSRVDVYHL